MAFTKRFTQFLRSPQEASVLVLTLAMMLVFSGQVLMMGMVTTKSLTETGALHSIGMAAREEAFSAMQDFETREVYPNFLSWVESSKSAAGEQHIDDTFFTTIYGPTSTTRKNTPNMAANTTLTAYTINNYTGTDWSNYRARIWDEATNDYVNGAFTTDVWLEDSEGWPYTIVAHVQGSGINQTLRRRSSILPPGYTDTERGLTPSAQPGPVPGPVNP